MAGEGPLDSAGRTWRLTMSPGAGTAARYNLAESTVRSLRFKEVLELAGIDRDLNELALDYGDPAGSPALRQAIAVRCGISAKAVLTLPGTMLGLYLLATAEGDGGEAVLVTPCFGPMRAALERARMQVREARLHFEDEYRPDVARIAAALRPETRLVCLADPQNPSGVRVPRGAIIALLAEMARRAPKALLFLDETYREATYGGAAPASAAGLDPRLITAGSLSKAHGAPGLRIGWLTIPDARLSDRLVAAKESLILSGSVLDEALAAVLIRQSESVLEPRRRALCEALAAVIRWQATVAERLEMVRPEAGALCCLRLNPRIINEAGVDRFWAALPQENLQLAPGIWFGETQRVFRLGFGHLPSAELAAALLAVARTLTAIA